VGGGGGRGRGATGPQIANGRGGNDNVFAISTGGMVHVMNPQIGTDQVPPVKLLPPNANVAGSILVDTTLYAATTGNCSGVANGVWSVDLASEAKAVQSYDTKGRRLPERCRRCLALTARCISPPVPGSQRSPTRSCRSTRKR
jgi:hypothetical protein